MSKEISEFRKEFGDDRRELVDRLDFISEQLKVLNTNIATMYELVSKIMAKLMASSMTK